MSALVTGLNVHQYNTHPFKDQKLTGMIRFELRIATVSSSRIEQNLRFRKLNGRDRFERVESALWSSPMKRALVSGQDGPSTSRLLLEFWISAVAVLAVFGSGFVEEHLLAFEVAK